MSAMDLTPIWQRLLTPEGYLQCLELVHCLHPHLDAADAIIREALQFVPSRLANQTRLPPTFAPYHARLSPWQMLQRALFATSQIWELDQEQAVHAKRPVYQPDAKVMLVRFVKHLVQYALVRADSYPIAVALGSCLYTYTPAMACDMVALPLQGARYQRRRHLKHAIAQATITRFRASCVLNAHGTFHTTVPKDDQYTLVQDAMRALRPWETPCLPDDPTQSWSERLANVENEWTRKHAILCSGEAPHACPGLHRLAQEWALEPHDAPQSKLRLPLFALEAQLPPSFTYYLDDDPPLTDDELEGRLAQVRASLSTMIQRRLTGSFTHGWLAVDGVMSGPMPLGSQPCTLAPIPASAVHLALYGADAIGLVPLVLFAIPEPRQGETCAHTLRVVLANGTAYTLTLHPIWDATDFVGWHGTLHGTNAVAAATAPDWPDAAVLAFDDLVQLVRLLGHEGTSCYAALWHRITTLTDTLQRLPDPAGHTATLLARLRLLATQMACLSQEHAASKAQPTYAKHRMLDSQPHSAMRKRLVHWVSTLWHPLWAGEAVTAAELSVQKHTFLQDDGKIAVTCQWRATSGAYPATLHMTWCADFPSPALLCARFVHPDDPEHIRVEFPLGQRLSGEALWTCGELGFDPTQEAWALMMVTRS